MTPEYRTRVYRRGENDAIVIEAEPRSLLNHSQPDQERSIFQGQEVVYLFGIDQGIKPGRHREVWRTSEHEAAALLVNSQPRVNCVDGTAWNGLGQDHAENST